MVAARGAPGGFCSDTAGSCRIPGAHNGVVGFRPSLGCYNAAGGIVPQTTSRDTVGTAVLLSSHNKTASAPHPSLLKQTA